MGFGIEEFKWKGVHGGGLWDLSGFAQKLLKPQL